MATSGTVSTTTFNTLKIIDHAFRRCKLPAQVISAEMQEYAKESLYLLLSDLANEKAPSWCIERIVIPIYEKVPIVPLPVGTVDVLNVLYRTPGALTPDTEDIQTTSYEAYFRDTATVDIFGIKWSAAPVDFTLSISVDGIDWTDVYSYTATESAGEWTWIDVPQATAAYYFKVSSASVLSYSELSLGTQAVEIPLGSMNKDTYTTQPNKFFTSRPLNYWYQRDLPIPILNIFPAPNSSAERSQLIVWRHRHIMDVGELSGDIEVPQRWVEAIIYSLALRLAEETPEVDPAILGYLSQKAMISLRAARDGDNDGSSTFIRPLISAYTR